MSNTRLYLVTIAGAEKPRLIEAASQASAVRHVAIGMISAEPAGALEAARMVQSGTAVETAGVAVVEAE